MDRVTWALGLVAGLTLIMMGLVLMVAGLGA